VVNRNSEVIASAITNLDLHDLARLSRTYNMPGCYIVTPLKDQQTLAKRLIAHWCDGVGKELHPTRCEALRCLRWWMTLPRSGRYSREWGEEPTVWATTASRQTAALPYREARRQLSESGPKLILLVLPGIAPSLLEGIDAVLETIRWEGPYNHLSVRCAAAILVDRLLVPGLDPTGSSQVWSVQWIYGRFQRSDRCNRTLRFGGSDES